MNALRCQCDGNGREWRGTLGAGSVYKSMNGPRAMAVYGAVGAGLSAANQIGQYITGSMSGGR